MIEGILGTTYGDANLDGVFNSQDLVAVFQVGEYEDDVLGQFVLGRRGLGLRRGFHDERHGAGVSKGRLHGGGTASVPSGRGECPIWRPHDPDHRRRGSLESMGRSHRRLEITDLVRSRALRH